MTSKQFKKLIKKYGSQQELSKKLGVSNGLISAMASGKFPISSRTVAKIKLLKKPHRVIFERQNIPGVISIRHVPITIEMKNGLKITVHGDLKEVIEKVRLM